MQVTNTAQTVIHNNTRQGEKIVGAGNSKAQTSLSKGFGSTPAAMFRNSTKDDYDTSTLNSSQKRILSLQDQITNLNSDVKIENDTKNNLLEPLQEELASLQEQVLKKQEDVPITDSNLKTNNKDIVAEYSKHVYKDGCDGCIDYTNPDYYKDQDYKDFVAGCRKEGYTDEQIYGFTHLVEAPEWVMEKHMHKITDIVKDVCSKNGFNYYERPGHIPDMEAILKKNGNNGKAAYEAMSQAFSDFEKTIWKQSAKDREGFSFTHDNGYEGAIWEMIIPPSPDPKKSRDPLSFIK